MCARSGALAHSYVLMSNHYHLLLETPQQANLVAEMKWFHGTYNPTLQPSTRVSYRAEGLRGHDENTAERLLRVDLESLDLRLEEVLEMRQSDERKQSIAWLLESRTVVGDEWVCCRLGMGHRSNVSRAVGAFRLPQDRERRRLHKIPAFIKVPGKEARLAQREPAARVMLWLATYVSGAAFQAAMLLMVPIRFLDNLPRSFA